MEMATLSMTCTRQVVWPYPGYLQQFSLRMPFLELPPKTYYPSQLERASPKILKVDRIGCRTFDRLLGVFSADPSNTAWLHSESNIESFASALAIESWKHMGGRLPGAEANDPVLLRIHAHVSWEISLE